jgi:hypothetical protein
MRWCLEPFAASKTRPIQKDIFAGTFRSELFIIVPAEKCSLLRNPLFLVGISRSSHAHEKVATNQVPSPHVSQALVG